MQYITTYTKPQNTMTNIETIRALLVTEAQTTETLQCLRERNATTDADRQALDAAIDASHKLRAQLRNVYRTLSIQSQTSLF